MIFITLGSQKFQFNRLLIKIDQLIDAGIITEKVIAQIGASDYVPRNYEFYDFMDETAFSEKVTEANLLITHGGTGAIIGAVKKGKKVIAVPRLAKFNEHVDDHQLQLLNEFEKMDIIIACYDLEDLGDAIKTIDTRKFQSYRSNAEAIINSLMEFIEEK